MVIILTMAVGTLRKLKVRVRQACRGSFASLLTLFAITVTCTKNGTTSTIATCTNGYDHCHLGSSDLSDCSFSNVERKYGGCSFCFPNGNPWD